MSKNFEQAYKELAQIEAPDLWDRIEAGLTSKSAPKNSNSKIDANEDIDVSGNIEIKADAETSEDIETNVDTKINAISGPNAEKKIPNKIWIFTGKYAGALAAILCVAVILPAAALIKRTEDKSFSGAAMEGSDMAEVAEESAADMAMPEEAAQMEAVAEEAEPEEEAAAAGAVEEDMSADGGADMGAAENAQASMEDAGAQTEASEEVERSDKDGVNRDGDTLASKELNVEKQQTSESEEAKKIDDMASAITAEGAPLPEGTILEGIVVEVRSMKDDTDRDLGEGTPGSVYTVVVKEDASGRLPTDSEIEVFVPAHASFALPVGETYVIDIAYTKEGEYPVVQRSEKKI